MSNLLPRIEFGLQALVCHQRVCPFCQGRQHAVVARKHGVVRIRQCETCSLYFTDPIYRSRIASLYDSSLYDAEGSTTAVPRQAELETLKSTMFETSDKNCSNQINALRQLSAGSRMLEIGSSWGYFLYQSRASGFDAMGVEPNRLRREYGVRELGVDIRSSIDDVQADGFDVIYSAHTLEHISEPNVFFSECFNRLKPGGLLAIEVPHFDPALFGPRALSVIGAVHPLGLSQSFFRVALPRAGFQPLGAYNDWTSAMARRATTLREGSLIVIAEKATTGPLVAQ
jgi:SAM-dependent methyltransferase